MLCPTDLYDSSQSTVKFSLDFENEKYPLPPLRPHIAAFSNTEVGFFIRGCLMVNNAGLNSLLPQRAQKDIKNSLSCIMLHCFVHHFSFKHSTLSVTHLSLVNVNVFLKDPRMKCCFIVSKSWIFPLDTYKSYFSLVLGTLQTQ